MGKNGRQRNFMIVAKFQKDQSQKAQAWVYIDITKLQINFMFVFLSYTTTTEKKIVSAMNFKFPSHKVIFLTKLGSKFQNDLRWHLIYFLGPNPHLPISITYLYGIFNCISQFAKSGKWCLYYVIAQV